MSELLIATLEKPSKFDVVELLKNVYSGTDSNAADHSKAINEFSELRNIAFLDTYELTVNSLESLYRYDFII